MNLLRMTWVDHSLPFHPLSASWWFSRVEFEYRNFPDRHWSRLALEIAIHKSGQQHFEKGIGEARRCGREP
jgi:hypothetical protein